MRGWGRQALSKHHPAGGAVHSGTCNRLAAGGWGVAVRVGYALFSQPEATQVLRYLMCIYLLKCLLCYKQSQRAQANNTPLKSQDNTCILHTHRTLSEIHPKSLLQQASQAKVRVSGHFFLALENVLLLASKLLKRVWLVMLFIWYIIGCNFYSYCFRFVFFKSFSV